MNAMLAAAPAVPHPAIVAAAQEPCKHRGLRLGQLTYPVILTTATALAAKQRAKAGRTCKLRTRRVRLAAEGFPQSVTDSDAGLFTSSSKSELVLEVPPKAGRPRVLVLGTGWASASFLQALTPEQAQLYDITVISMRNFFLYTPLLPTCTMGSIEERSIVTPIREMAAGKADFLEARCEGIDVEKKVVRCSRARRSKVSSNAQYHRFPDKEEGEKYTFEMPYDILIYGVGAKTNDFNVPGVKQHSFYFKELIDARNVRSRISDLFEEAALPTMSPEDRDALLNFIIVGGGPTGVEIAADLADFVDEDCKRLYPKLQDQVTINLVNMEDHLLSTYSRDISEKSLEVFKAKGVKVLNGWRVTEITEDVVKMTTKQGDYKEIPHGCVIWAAGVKPTSLTQQVKADLQGLNKGSREAELQAKVRGLSTDEWLNVWGSKGSIFALGDASTVQQECACFFAQELFQEADVENTGRLSIHALRDLLRSNSERHPQFEAYAQYLEEAYTDSFLDDTFAEIAQVFGKKDRKEHVVWRQSFGQRVIDRIRPKRREEVHEDFRSVNLLDEESITFESFKALLASIHKTLETFPPTAQVAAQQGSYLADLFGKGCLKGDEESLQKLKEESEPFTYFHKGALAYLGGDHAAFDLPLVGPVSGPLAGLAWRAYETSAQISWKNRALVGLDWVKTKIFGRDPSRV